MFISPEREPGSLYQCNPRFDVSHGCRTTPGHHVQHGRHTVRTRMTKTLVATSILPLHARTTGMPAGMALRRAINQACAQIPPAHLCCIHTSALILTYATVTELASERICSIWSRTFGLKRSLT
jgi:hypothetical protein